ncbi:hypothetical protein FQR65_LT13347 [Abscondita terminalis]|nr:hypothetical protein FQR65_LT13347 [Abscondita terminalis]
MQVIDYSIHVFLSRELLTPLDNLWDVDGNLGAQQLSHEEVNNKFGNSGYGLLLSRADTTPPIADPIGAETVLSTFHVLAREKFRTGYEPRQMTVLDSYCDAAGFQKSSNLSFGI